MSPPPDLDDLSAAELKALVLALLARVGELERTVAAQRDEIARLKTVPARPALKPSGMESATQAKPGAELVGRAKVGARRRRGGSFTRIA